MTQLIWLEMSEISKFWALDNERKLEKRGDLDEKNERHGEDAFSRVSVGKNFFLSAVVSARIFAPKLPNCNDIKSAHVRRRTFKS